VLEQGYMITELLERQINICPFMQFKVNVTTWHTNPKHYQPQRFKSIAISKFSVVLPTITVSLG